MKRILLISFLVVVLKWSSSGQSKNIPGEYTFLFYNTENFFDCQNDPSTADDEFTPSGARNWTPTRFKAKAERIGKVILAAGRWNPPVFVGLCEVENLSVVETLTKTSALSSHSYQIIHRDSPDERGIDVAVIYRPDVFKPIDYLAIPVVDPSDQAFRTRDILAVTGVFNGRDTLHIFINHWPSHYGGIMETIAYRKLAASALKSSIDRLIAQSPQAKIILMGDFNDTPNDESLVTILGAKAADDVALPGDLVNLSASWLSRTIQTIKSQYVWTVFDQVICSDNLLEKGHGLRISGAEIFDAGFLLEPDEKFGGVKPKRTYVGFKYQEGFSDHLPVLVRLVREN